MAGYETKPLDVTTWPAFAELVERHNGVWGGCWCIGFHSEGGERGTDHRAKKELRVRNGEAHAALVFDGERCVGWCQFGSPEDVDGRKVSSSFLYNATLAMFEAEGFTRVRQLGKNSWLVSKRVRARRATG